jgi:hypothetical protein
MNNSIPPSQCLEDKGTTHQPNSPSPRCEEKGPGDEELRHRPGHYGRDPRLHSASPFRPLFKRIGQSLALLTSR